MNEKVLGHLRRAGGALLAAVKEAGPGELAEDLMSLLDLLTIALMTGLATMAIGQKTQESGFQVSQEPVEA